MCRFIQQDILALTTNWMREASQDFDFICASSPCEQFSVHGMRCFHKNPPYPELGIKLFNHTRALCEATDLPYVMENVRAAEPFVGRAKMRCGPFALWGSGVPTILPQGIKKGNRFRGAPGNYMASCPADVDRKEWRMRWQKQVEKAAGGRRHVANYAAEIPPELSACVADYAERLLEMRATA